MISVYQGIFARRRGKTQRQPNSLVVSRLGAAIMILALVLFENEFLNIVAISFTALIVNELIMVALEITIWYVFILPLAPGK
jgi:hypothetical protein